MNDRNPHNTVITDSTSGEWVEAINNPRHRRALDGLAAGPRTAKELNEIIGTVNAHPYLMRLRKLGCTIEHETVTGTDRDGISCRFNRYWLGDGARRKYLAYRAKGDKC